jgi:hypothetical protein
MIPKDVVEDAVAAILKDDRSYCECRRSPFDGHDVNPPCATRIKVTEHVTLTLEIATAHLQNVAARAQTPTEKSQWGIFGVSSPAGAEPIIPARFPSREAALTYIRAHYPSPEFLEVRGKTLAGWSA